MTLKTLKDIAEDIEEEFSFFSINEATIKSFQTIKQEAIKWAKELMDDNEPLNAVGFIKEFFNLTREDLK